MKFSLVAALALVAPAFALPITNEGAVDSTSVLNSTITAPESDVPGYANGVEFPFSEDAIDTVVLLGPDVGVIVVDDAVFFVNITMAEATYSE